MSFPIYHAHGVDAGPRRLVHRNYSCTKSSTLETPRQVACTVTRSKEGSAARATSVEPGDPSRAIGSFETMCGAGHQTEHPGDNVARPRLAPSTMGGGVGAIEVVSTTAAVRVCARHSYLSKSRW